MIIIECKIRKKLHLNFSLIKGHQILTKDLQGI